MVCARLFGREVWIGHELHLPQVKFDRVEEGGQQQVYIEPPSDPGPATLRLFPPEEGHPSHHGGQEARHELRR